MVSFVCQKVAQAVVKREISQLSNVIVRGQKLDELPPEKKREITPEASC